MSSASIDEIASGGAPPAAARVLRGWRPLHAWSRRRRAAVAAAIAAATCALATLAGMTTDFAGSTAAGAALAAARRDLADARRAQQALPALRRAAAASDSRRKAGHSADDARNVSELAATTGISLVSLEPGAPGGHGDESFRVLKLAAQGEFPQLRAFLRALAHSPMLIAPTEVAIRHSGSRLSLAAALSVFDALPSPPDALSDDEAPIPPDPFAATRIGGAGAVDDLRLVGLLRDRTHAMALIETPRGTDAVERGGRIDGERVMQIATEQVTLAAGGTTRVLGWTEDGR